jgi:amidase
MPVKSPPLFPLWTGAVAFLACTIYLFTVLLSANSSEPKSAMSKATFDVLSADVKILQTLLQRGSVNSVGLVETYLAQIKKHDRYLHAMIQTTPIETVSSIAKALDHERQEGKLRSPLHGIPIIIKVDSILLDTMIVLMVKLG